MSQLVVPREARPQVRLGSICLRSGRQVADHRLSGPNHQTGTGDFKDVPLTRLVSHEGRQNQDSDSSNYSRRLPTRFPSG